MNTGILSLVLPIGRYI